MPKKITAKKHGGNDRFSWAVFIDGRMFISGLTRSEVPYYKKMAEDVLKARKDGGIVARR